MHFLQLITTILIYQFIRRVQQTVHRIRLDHAFIQNILKFTVRCLLRNCELGDQVHIHALSRRLGVTVEVLHQLGVIIICWHMHFGISFIFVYANDFWKYFSNNDILLHILFHFVIWLGQTQPFFKIILRLLLCLRLLFLWTQSSFVILHGHEEDIAVPRFKAQLLLLLSSESIVSWWTVQIFFFVFYIGIFMLFILSRSRH